MNTVTLLQPTQIVFGSDCARQAGPWLVERKVQRVLLITSSPVRAQLGSLLNDLEQAGIAALHAPPVDAEPTVLDLERTLDQARGEAVDGVLGIGGGSPMDVAKLVAALARHQQQWPEVVGINRLTRRDLPLLCLPTTSGTGSEVSPNAILLDESDDSKKGAVSPHLVPDAAFIDPLLTLSVPATVTAATGLDALTHCIEAYANKFAHPLVDGYALQGVKLIAAHLLRAVENGNDIEAREALAMGSLLGGLCLGPVNTAAVHALAYPLGGRFHVAHGVSNAVLLPHVLRFNLGQAPERYADLAVAMGVAAGPTPRATAERGVERLVELSRACGVPQRLPGLGVPRDAIPDLARAAMQVTRLLKNNLRPLTEADAVAIYEEAC